MIRCELYPLHMPVLKCIPVFMPPPKVPIRPGQKLLFLQGKPPSIGSLSYLLWGFHKSTQYISLHGVMGLICVAVHCYSPSVSLWCLADSKYSANVERPDAFSLFATRLKDMVQLSSVTSLILSWSHPPTQLSKVSIIKCQIHPFLWSSMTPVLVPFHCVPLPFSAFFTTSLKCQPPP